MDMQNEDDAVNNNRRTIYDYLRIIVKRKKFIIVIFLISVISTAVINLFMPKIYRGEIILIAKAPDIVNSIELIDIIGHRKESIFVGGLITGMRVTDVKGNEHKIKVTIESTDIKNIQSAFNQPLDYINNNPDYNKRIRDKKAEAERQIKELTFLILKQREFYKYYEKLLKEEKLRVITFNPADLREQISDLEEKKFSFEKALAELRCVEKDSVYILKDPVKPRTAINTAMAGVVSLLVGIFLAIYTESENMSGLSGKE